MCVSNGWREYRLPHLYNLRDGYSARTNVLRRLGAGVMDIDPWFQVMRCILRFMEILDRSANSGKIKLFRTRLGRGK
jgi:hypothetical protein